MFHCRRLRVVGESDPIERALVLSLVPEKDFVTADKRGMKLLRLPIVSRRRCARDTVRLRGDDSSAEYDADDVPRHDSDVPREEASVMRGAIPPICQRRVSGTPVRLYSPKATLAAGALSQPASAQTREGCDRDSARCANVARPDICDRDCEDGPGRMFGGAAGCCERPPEPSGASVLRDSHASLVYTTSRPPPRAVLLRRAHSTATAQTTSRSAAPPPAPA